MKSFFSIFLFLLIQPFIFSQKGYDGGYIILNNGDTLRGKIKDRKYTTSPGNSDKISFIDDKGNKNKLSPNKIKAYSKRASMFYRSLPVGHEAKMQFVQILEYGEVILFGYSSNSFVSETISSIKPTSSKDNHAIQKSDVVYFYQRNKDPNSLMKVKHDKFESVSLFYFKDDAELIKKIEDKSLKYGDIELVVKTYNEFAAKK